MGYAYTVRVPERAAFGVRRRSASTVASVLLLLAAAGAATALTLPSSAAPPTHPTLLTPISTTATPR